MANEAVVLVSGAWTGSWIWRHVVPQLRERELNVSAITLTGLGDRRHTATSDTTLSTHISDLIDHIEMEDFDRVILVGWSYGGMVITGVADMLPSKVDRLIYLDAFVPEDGKALVDYLQPQGRAAHEAFASRNEPIPALPLEVFGVEDRAVVDFVVPRLTHQPWRTFFEPARLTGAAGTVPKSYILCAGASRVHFEDTYQRMQASSNTRTATIDADHFCMLSAPEMTAAAIAHNVLGSA